MKSEAVIQIIQRLEEELAALVRAAKAAHEEATHEESKPEDQYDTRGLEASYLASAQARRAEELQRTIGYFRSVSLAQLQLVHVESAGKAQTYLISQVGGGMTVQVDGKPVLVMTPDSPLGSELSDRKAGDLVEVEVRGSTKSYRILSIE